MPDLTPIITASDTIARDILTPAIIQQMERPLPPGRDTCSYFQTDYPHEGHRFHLFVTYSQHQPIPTENGYFLMLVPLHQISWEEFRATYIAPWLARGKNLVHGHIDTHHAFAQ
jgi:hypothetical protein